MLATQQKKMICNGVFKFNLIKTAASLSSGLLALDLDVQVLFLC